MKAVKSARDYKDGILKKSEKDDGAYIHVGYSLWYLIHKWQKKSKICWSTTEKTITNHQPDDQEVDLENEYDGDFWIKVGLIKELLNIAKPLISSNLRENSSYCQVHYWHIRLMFKLGRRFFAI